MDANERSNVVVAIDNLLELICLYFEGNEEILAVNNLKEIFLAYQDLQADWNVSNDCLQKLKDLVDKDQLNSSINIEEEYEKLLAKAGKKRYNKENVTKEFDIKVNKCLISKNDNDVMETQSVITLIDPITKKIMTKPVKNIHCKHTYDLDTIVEMIKSKGRKGMKCPYQGCANTKQLCTDDLVEDEVVLRKLQQMSEKDKT